MLACACVVLAVALANAIYLLRVGSANPLLYRSGLGSPTPGFTKGGIGIDPNDGWTAQALGRLAATMWRGGEIPLWNPYEGLGQPLAGEMQSAALFLPFILLQSLPNGFLLMHLALELVAGVSTLGLLRTLKLSWPAATVGACLFALNGAFSVMTNAPFNPIAFLPMALWGVELIADGAQRGRFPRLGVWLTSWAVALMLFAGFPETAYLQGLLIAAWSVVRLAQARGGRRSFAALTLTSALLGCLLAAPILAAFHHFLGFGYTAYHAGAANNASYPLTHLATFFAPFLTGPLGNHAFGLQAGYITAATLVLALVGLLGRSERGLKVTLCVICAVLLLNMYGWQPIKHALNLVPGMSSIMVNKYGIVILELAATVLCAFGIDRMIRSEVRARTSVICAVVVLAWLGGCAVWLANQGYADHPHWTAVVLVWAAAVLLSLLALLLTSARGRRWATRAALIAAVVVVADAAATFAIPSTSASHTTTVDLDPVRFLQSHLGTSRFYTLGPIQPNYGSYFQIAQLNANDLPVPAKYSDFVLTKLQPPRGSAGAEAFADHSNGYQLVFANPSTQQERLLLQAYGQQQSYFREASVKYVVARAGVADDATAAKYGLLPAFKDRKVQIWLDPAASPYYTTDSGCTIAAQTLMSLTVNCPRAGTLTRRGLSTPGWTVTINGATKTVDDSDNLFQTVELPAGRSTVDFRYAPDHFTAAAAVSAGLCALMVLEAAIFAIRRRRRDHSATDTASLTV